MIGIEEKQLAILVDKAINEMLSEDQAKLFSYTKKINHPNIYSFLQLAGDRKLTRSFWSSNSNDVTILGAGQAVTIQAEGQRFRSIENDWNELLKRATIHNPFEKQGTGIVGLGGFAFDPKKESTHLWRNFPAGQLTIPQVMVTIVDNQCYLTFNMYLHTNDHGFQLMEEYKELESYLLGESNFLKQDINMIEKKEVNPQQWMHTVQKATEEMKTSITNKIVLAREIRLRFDKRADIPSIIRKLLETQSNSYIFAYEIDGDCFVGATPERLVKVEGNKLFSTCLAGTAPRGKTTKEDQKIAEDLFTDPKNRKEHDYVVQMIRKAVERYCTNVDIPSEPQVYIYKTLQHLYTPVTAKLMNSNSIFSIIEELHPTPALGGTPREESMSFIRNNERLDRGWYGAPIGWLDSNNNGEFAVAIRSAMIQGTEASLFAGCGIVSDSDPVSEYEETNIKLMPMLSVLGG
ncbi:MULTISPECIES: isochorismate synthase [Oceanobacillus]|uniref:Isochorismate synthase MenF n=1 Tax=Oceanobacillus kimchii TaxID=746691 RepID=A0ABQ5TJE2_9BACI|nr:MULTISPECIES: isochorismate synthase [Oceanobacillus]MBT2601223.1 isochorismate synthase [Oceanobacillus sp. ISL-74]MBT2652448.1 isochorismate synthase [Oceanobacillus sp. ISL-73]MCT1579115.1 isochorismate synthase [Oceanobacillus kimchii]MCT2137357.1 isochorismate synthase [Oceanobacillus kimchii]GLO66993.1 isochorismate synthase MenF [Oceanobacillus kimchii]